MIIKCIKQETNSETKGNLFDIFRNNMLQVTIIFIILWFSNSLISYGLQLIYTLTIRDLGIDFVEDNTNSIEIIK